MIILYKDPGVNYTELNRFSPPEDKQKFTELCKVCKIRMKKC